MGFAAFTRPALFLQSENGKRCVSDAQRNRASGESVALNSVRFLNKKRKQGCTTPVKRYIAHNAAPKWFSKLNGDRGFVGSSRLLSPDAENDCQQNGASFERKNPAFLYKAARKIGNLSSEKKVGGLQESSSCGTTSPKRTNSNTTVGIVSTYSLGITASNPDNGNNFREPANKRPEIQPSAGAGRGWKLLGGTAAAAALTVAGGTALKGIRSGSAQASCGHGGFGDPGSGHGGGGDWSCGGGEGGQGGFDAGSGEGFIANSILDTDSEQEKMPPVSVTLVKRTSVAARPSLASLSSAAGDFIDGEAPIGGDYTSERFATADSYQTPGLLNSRSPYSPTSVGQDGQSFVERSHYEQDEDLFLGFKADDRPSAGDQQDDLRRNEELPATRSSPSYDDSSSGKPSSSKQTYISHYSAYQDQYHVPSGYPTSSHPTPQDFISFVPDTRTTITSEPLGIGQERHDGFKSHPVHEGTDTLSWVSGLLDSVLGKRSGDQNCRGEDNQHGDDEKKGLVAETAALALKLLSEKGDDFAKKFETNALRRLQRETFSDLLKVRERLDRLEHKTGLCGKSSGDSLSGARTNLKGEVSSGAAFIVTEDSACVHSRAALQHAGLRTGLDVRFTFETPMREADTLTTQVGVGQGSGMGDGNCFGGPLTLQKINYVAQISDSLSLTVAPLGARASDMSDTVDHLQGQALTTFAGSGPALYQHCKGSAIGASLKSSSVLLSMSQFLSGWGSSTPDGISEPLCLSTLAQFMAQPCDHLVLSLSAVNNVWPSPPPPTSTRLHWSEMGPLVLCKTITRPTGAFVFNPTRSSSVHPILAQGNLPTESWNPPDNMRNRGIAMQSVALAGEFDLGYRVSLGGWAQVERGDWLSEFEKKEFQWNMSIAKCTGQNVNWGMSIGRRMREDWHGDGLSPVINDGPDDPSTSHLQMEAFIRTGCGKGFTLQSGIVYIVEKHSQTPAFMLRSSWTM